MTEDDAMEVIQLVQESLLDAFTTEIGAIDGFGGSTRTGNGQSLPKQVIIEYFVTNIQQF